MAEYNARDRLNLEISVLSYMIHHDVKPLLSAKNFKWQLTKEVFKAINDSSYKVSMKVAPFDMDIINMIFDEDYESCGFDAFRLDVNRLRRMS